MANNITDYRYTLFSDRKVVEKVFFIVWGMTVTLAKPHTFKFGSGIMMPMPCASVPLRVAAAWQSPGGHALA
jgi:hypothetical protein